MKDKNNIMQVNRSVQIIDGDILKITRNFAEKNLSKICLKYAEEVSETHYFWTFEENAYAVLFEIPLVFKDTILDIYDLKQVQVLAYKLSTVSKMYKEEKKITQDNFMKMLKENSEKEIVF